MANNIIIPDTKTYSIHTAYTKLYSKYLPGFDVLSFTRMDIHPAYCRRAFHRRITTQQLRIQNTDL